MIDTGACSSPSLTNIDSANVCLVQNNMVQNMDLKISSETSCYIKMFGDTNLQNKASF